MGPEYKGMGSAKGGHSVRLPVVICADGEGSEGRFVKSLFLIKILCVDGTRLWDFGKNLP